MPPRRVSLRASSPDKAAARGAKRRADSRSPSPTARSARAAAGRVRGSSDIEFEDEERTPAPPAKAAAASPPAKAARIAQPKKAGASSRAPRPPAEPHDADEDAAPSLFPKADAWLARDPQAVARWRRTRSLKQCVEASRSEGGADGAPWAAVEAPPSVRPRPKFCDVTGLPAPYVDPATRMRYYSADVLAFIRTLSPEQVQQYLRLRHAHTVI